MVMRQVKMMMPEFGTFMAVVLLTLATSAFGQASGFNFTLEFGHHLEEQDPPESFGNASAVGLAYQQDLSRRFGLGLDVFWGFETKETKSVEAIYSAKYFFSDNSYTAPYIGSFIGVQKLKTSFTEYVPASNGYTTSRNVEAKRLQVPIGLRAGLRGGLDGYFGELFVQAGYAIGNGNYYVADGKQVKSSPLFLGLGFSFLGFGWDH